MSYSVGDVRQIFIEKLKEEEFVTDKTGCKMIEWVGATFIADEPAIFGTVNEDYVQREIMWYEMRSLNVNDIPPPVPAIWKQVATPDGRINSNYGYLIYSKDNYQQFLNCLHTLQRDPDSRRAIMIYTRPSMQIEYNTDGMSDFICTNAVQYVIRQGKVHAIVQMRSNDVWAGFRNDYAWQKHVLHLLSSGLGLPMGNIHWQVGSLHCYEKDFYLVDHASKTGDFTIKKSEYRILYPESKWN
jgi:thymidylate synthase